MLEWVPKLECSNPACLTGKHIQLPYSNLQQIVGNQPDWPRDDWKAFVLCRDCGAGRIYSKENVRWGLSQPFLPGIWGQTSFLQIELKCVQKNCESPVKVHMLFDRDWQRWIESLKKKLFPLVGDPRCANGFAAKIPIELLLVRSLDDFGEASL